MCWLPIRIVPLLFGSAFVLYGLQGVCSCVAVSYTHLDVYKRQEEQRLFEKEQKELKKKHHISEQEDRIVVEKDNMTKFFIRTGGSLVRIAANICIGALAIIGLAALVYPAPRAELLVVWKTILEELLSFM